MRVVVTGSTGRLGREVVAVAARAGHEVLGLSRHEPEPCDLADAAAAHRRIVEFAADLVVHAAGATDVDACERDAADAVRRNVGATRNVAEAAAAAGAHLVYVSTNHVFDGDLDRPNREDDPTSPRSVYGATKLAGERLVGRAATIVRTAWLSTRDGAGVLGSILTAADRPGRLHFIDDEVAQPTFAFDLAPVLLQLGEARHAGCVHATNEGSVSSFELARAVLAAIGDDPERVVPITADELAGRIAPRPRNGVLDTGLLRATLGEGLPDHRASLDAALRDLRPRA
jgi:dTDP-4-dehydrorhamnose reductase